MVHNRGQITNLVLFVEPQRAQLDSISILDHPKNLDEKSEFIGSPRNWKNKTIGINKERRRDSRELERVILKALGMVSHYH